MKSVRNTLNTITETYEGPLEIALPNAGEAPLCSFSGKPAHFYIGLSGPGYNDEIRLMGAICTEFVETSIVNVLGQGVGDIQWPVILDLKKNIYYHSHDAHLKGYSATMGWKEILRFKTKD
ncbi:hypothetical protein [Arenibacter palladensis]|jgi:hypothetical protein|uniref:hypothetical protein n=1 Tax=Arenibacter palladensis TaxID=237373 RepID=UPI0026E22DD0|nr:hypothetical protein [Arenibacter palladensis]MDO6602185.1 hypothetical protein [Arenibacter palladensis]|tara:strand:+ start:74 stop:436 length:363 start_codon:yes stop_codon:yes gene_type:complete